MNLVEGMQSSSCPGNHHPYLHASGCYNQGHADLMFRKIFELSWSDKLHVEMDLVWF